MGMTCISLQKDLHKTYEAGEEPMVDVFGRWQTELYMAPPVVNVSTVRTCYWPGHLKNSNVYIHLKSQFWGWYIPSTLCGILVLVLQPACMRNVSTPCCRNYVIYTDSHLYVFSPLKGQNSKEWIWKCGAVSTMDAACWKCTSPRL